MPAAYNPDAPSVDQSNGPHPSHTGIGSRFNTPDSRGPVQVGAGVTEAIAEFKRGAFTVEDLKQLAFAMDCQVVSGKDGATVHAKLSGLDEKATAMERRAVMAEAAFVGKTGLTVESLSAIALTMGGRFVSDADAIAISARISDLEKQVGDLTAPKTDAA